MRLGQPALGTSERREVERGAKLVQDGTLAPRHGKRLVQASFRPLVVVGGATKKQKAPDAM